MNAQPHSVASVEAIPAEPTLDFATEQICSGRLAGVTLRTVVNAEDPREVLIPLKLATRIGQLLLAYTERVQRQQQKEDARRAKLGLAPAPERLYRPARRTQKKTPTGAIRFVFELPPTTEHEWLYPLQGAFILNGVRQELTTAICLPPHYWSPVDQRVRKPKQLAHHHLAFTQERIQRANAQLATLQSRVKVAYLSLPEDQRTAQNVHRLLTSSTVCSSSHQKAA